MNILIIAFTALFSMGAIAKSDSKEVKTVKSFDAFREEQQGPAEQLDNLYVRKNRKLLENPRNPAMVKGFQGIGEDKKEME